MGINSMEFNEINPQFAGISREASMLIRRQNSAARAAFRARQMELRAAQAAYQAQLIAKAECDARSAAEAEMKRLYPPEQAAAILSFLPKPERWDNRKG